MQHAAQNNFPIIIIYIIKHRLEHPFLDIIV